jgi:hypothetical protein
MSRSPHATRVLVVSAAACIALACSVGQGRGRVTGSVLVRDCRVDIPAYDMAPTFFVADFIDEPETIEGYRREAVTLRIQRGSSAEDHTDGIAIFIRSVDEIQTSMIGVPITLTPSSLTARPLVTATLYLGGSCPSGRPNSDYFIIPATLGAVAGQITFDAVYAPSVAGSGLQFAAHFEGLRFESVDSPEDRNALLDGEFAFFYQRGRPAQRFP